MVRRDGAIGGMMVWCEGAIGGTMVRAKGGGRGVHNYISYHVMSCHVMSHAIARDGNCDAMAGVEAQ